MSCDKAEQAIASTAPTALDEPSCGGTYCVTPDTERAGIANSVKQLSPSTEPLSRVTPDDQPVQSLKEPIASPAPTARDEPSGPEERRQRRGDGGAGESCALRAPARPYDLGAEA